MKLSEAIGINTHFSYTSTPYFKNATQVVGFLEAIGVGWYRDGFWARLQGDPILSIHQSITGLRSLLCVSWASLVAMVPTLTINATVTDVEAAAALLAAACKLYGNVGAIEGLNEPDISGMPSWVERTRVTQAVVHAASGMLGVPALGPSLVTAGAATRLGKLPLDLQSIHCYYPGTQPTMDLPGPIDAEGNHSQTLAWRMDLMPGRAWVTETGYAQGTISGQVTPEQAAAYLPDSLLLMLLEGVERVFVYELGPVTPFGLLDAALVPTPAYTALQSLLTNMGSMNLKAGHTSPAEVC